MIPAGTYTNVPRCGKLQIDWVEWALDAMIDYWTNEAPHEGAGKAESGWPVLELEQLPEKLGSTIVLEDCPDTVVGDLLYRLEELAPGLVENEMPDNWRAEMRALDTLTQRIRAGRKVDASALSTCVTEDEL